MQRLQLNNSVVITAKLHTNTGTPKDITAVKLVIDTPTNTEVEFEETALNFTYFQPIGTDTIGYKFRPTSKGVYKFSWTFFSGSDSINTVCRFIVE